MPIGPRILLLSLALLALVTSQLVMPGVAGAWPALPGSLLRVLADAANTTAPRHGAHASQPTTLFVETIGRQQVRIETRNGTAVTRITAGQHYLLLVIDMSTSCAVALDGDRVHRRTEAAFIGVRRWPTTFPAGEYGLQCDGASGRSSTTFDSVIR